MYFLRRAKARPPQRPASRRPVLETLESRVNPYNVSGGAWTTPDLITISFVPDSTDMGVIDGGGNTMYSDLAGDFTSKFGSASAWQNQILKAAQVWAQQTNINFALVADDGVQIGSGSYQEGDPNHGDIRIGGYDFGFNTLGLAELPPPLTNYDIAGDISLNTGMNFQINGDYNLFTVAMHEIGHALGLEHSGNSAAVMKNGYSGSMNGLNVDDINGIRSIYGGARSADAYDAVAANSTFATASNITSTINSTTKAALVDSLDITSTTDVDFFKFTAPSGGTGSLNVTVTSQGRSLLAPKLYVYNSSQSQLGYANGTGLYGTSLSLNLSNITAGATYYVKVVGADATAFGTGRYALSLNMGTGSNPTVPSINTAVANGDPLVYGGNDALEVNDNDLPGDCKSHRGDDRQPIGDPRDAAPSKKQDGPAKANINSATTASYRSDTGHVRFASNDAHLEALQGWLEGKSKKGR